MGFRTSRFWSPAIRYPAIQTTGLLTLAPAGLSPAEHTRFSWTHFRTVGFPQSGFKAGLSDRTFLDIALLKPSTRPSQCCSKFDLSFVRSAADIASGFRAPAYSALIRTAMHTAASAVLLQGSSLWCGVVVSAPSSLNRPHGPHSTTQDNFDAQRLYALSCYCGSLL